MRSIHAGSCMNGHPVIIQGGMGAGVSNWRLARAVALEGELGVVSGVALECILARRLQGGDVGGHMRRALEHFPLRAAARRILDRYFIEGGRAEGTPYKLIPMHSLRSSRDLVELAIAGNFVEVWLAREGHQNPVGINYLEKIQLPHLYAIYGAMLAGVGYILMGAGIPLKIPGVLDAYVNHEAATYPIYVNGAQESETATVSFDPKEYLEAPLPPLQRPRFLAIIASNTLATTMLRKANGRVDGFVIEGPTAGGHNAPPRGKLQVDETGEPIYGERDEVDLAKLAELGLPFWLAGGYGSAEKLRQALELGAAGVQMGTAFALCRESGFAEPHRRTLLKLVKSNSVHVRTDMLASPTGFPFKVGEVEGTSSQEEVYAARPRLCDVGQLREAYRTDDGSVAFRCAAEPIANYLAKGGTLEATAGRRCLCNALVSNIAMPQIQAGGYVEPALLTVGNDLAGVGRFLTNGAEDYSAAQVIQAMRAGMSPAQVCQLTGDSLGTEGSA